MNCQQCGSHILATMQIVWNGYPYHPDCIGEAIAQKKAAGEQTLATNDGFEDEFPHGISEDDYFDELEDYENEEIEDYPDVSDDVLAQIPPSVGNGSVVIPEAAEPFRREVSRCSSSRQLLD